MFQQLNIRVGIKICLGVRGLEYTTMTTMTGNSDDGRDSH